MRTDKIFSKAEEKYGKGMQIVQTIEELSELQKELCKYYKFSSGVKCNYSKKRILNEIADVEIMLSQVKRFLKLSQEVVDERKFVKLYSLSRRLKEDD